MNKTYSLIWNHAKQCWTVANEHARRHGKPGGGRRLLLSLIAALGLSGAAMAQSVLPSGGTVAGGSGSIFTYDNNKIMTVSQSSDKLIVNWQDFSVGKDNTVSFNQPNSSSIALNRVISGSASNIQGRIDANGRVFLVNPNGVLFGSNAQVNVGGLVATTQGISDADFMGGNYRFAGNSAASIQNDGTINAAQGGSVALLGAKVTNNGVIQAQLGSIALGAGEAFTVNFDGSGLLNLQVDPTAVNVLAKNGGLLRADGGRVLMTANSSKALLETVVNNQGTIEAKTLNNKSGKIVLDGHSQGTVQVSGALNASAVNTVGNGGEIVTTGGNVQVALATQADTRATNGQYGTWTISAPEINVNPTGANPLFISLYADTLSRNLGTTNVSLVSQHGNLYQEGSIAWNAPTKLSMKAVGNININGNITASGMFSGLALDHGGVYRLRPGNRVGLTGTGATFSSNGNQYNVIQNLAQLQAVGNNLNGLYVLGTNISGGNKSFAAIGDGAVFNGVLDGLGNTISNIAITGKGPYIGLIGNNAGTIANLNLTASSASGASSTATMVEVGTIAGRNSGTVLNVTSNASVAGSASRTNTVGGLVGVNTGRIQDSHVSSGSVTGNTYTQALGGMVGENRGGTMIGLTSAANVVAYTMQRNAIGGVGGLVGLNNGGQISDATVTGNVSSSYAGLNIGGLVGYNRNGGSLDNVLSAGTVTGYSTSIVGGLVGLNENSAIRNSYTLSKVTGSSTTAIGGAVGMNQHGGIVENVRAEGAVYDVYGANVGGLAGANNGGVINSGEARGAVTGGANSRVGGLVGANNGGDITDSVARGKVTGGSTSQAGGLVGYNSGNLRMVEASGEVYAGTGSRVGGLVGTNAAAVGYVIDLANASGNVKGESRSEVGGLVGYNQGEISNASASGMVSGGTYATMGGLVGSNQGKVSQSVASGKVNVLSNYAHVGGGLVGINYGTMNWNATFGEAAKLPAAGANYGTIN